MPRSTFHASDSESHSSDNNDRQSLQSRKSRMQRQTTTQRKNEKKLYSLLKIKQYGHLLSLKSCVSLRTNGWNPVSLSRGTSLSRLSRNSSPFTSRILGYYIKRLRPGSGERLKSERHLVWARLCHCTQSCLGTRISNSRNV